MIPKVLSKIGFVCHVFVMTLPSHTIQSTYQHPTRDPGSPCLRVAVSPPTSQQNHDRSLTTSLRPSLYRVNRHTDARENYVLARKRAVAVGGDRVAGTPARGGGAVYQSGADGPGAGDGDRTGAGCRGCGHVDGRVCATVSFAAGMSGRHTETAGSRLNSSHLGISD